jgi:cytosine permease
LNENDDYSEIKISDKDLVSWPRIASISAMLSFSLPSFITGLEIQQALTVHDTLLALIIGSIILIIIGGIMATIGIKSRLSSYLLVRIAFGNTGAAIVNIAFAISLLGWFGVNIDLFSDAVVRLLSAQFNLVVPEWPIEIFAGLCMISTTLYGFKAINIISTALIPILIFVTIKMFIGSLEEMSIAQFWVLEKTSTLSLSEGVASIVGVIIIGAIILPDISRFSKQKSGGFQIAFWSYGAAQLLVLFVTCFAASASDITEILDLMLSLNLGLLAFVIIVIGCWVLNSLNLYSTTLSIAATFPKFNQKIITMVLGVIGMLAAFMNILDNFLSFLSFLSTIFVPVAGVIIVDFIFIKGDCYNLDTLSNNQQFSSPAFIAWIIGALISVLNGTYSWLSLTGISVLDAIFLTGLVYAILAKTTKKSLSTSKPST